MHDPFSSPGLLDLAARDQLAPRLSEGDVWAEVIPTLPPEIRADAEARRRLGIERYGLPLQRGNGRDMVLDGYQEALDGIAYAAGDRVRPDRALLPTDRRRPLGPGDRSGDAGPLGPAVGPGGRRR